MALIFALSAQSDLNSGLGTIDFVGRKLIHATEYGVLCLLWWRALRTVVESDRAIILAVAISIAYAATDEFHQTFISGRHGTPVDVLIDGAGAGVAAALIARRS